MDEFDALAKVATSSLAKTGDYTAAMILCDFLQERNDPRGESLRSLLDKQQAFIALLCDNKFSYRVVSKRLLREYADDIKRHLMHKPGKRPSRAANVSGAKLHPPT